MDNEGHFFWKNILSTNSLPRIYLLEYLIAAVRYTGMLHMRTHRKYSVIIMCYGVAS